MRSTESLEVAGVVLRPAATGVPDRACASMLSRAWLPPEIPPEIAVAVATAGATGATGAAARGVGVETALTAAGVAAMVEHTPVVPNEEQMHEKFASLYAAYPSLAKTASGLDMPKFNQEIWTMWDARRHPEEYYPARVFDMAYVDGAFEYKIEWLTNANYPTLNSGSFVDEDETKHADSTVLDRKMSDWSYSKPRTGGAGPSSS